MVPPFRRRRLQRVDGHAGPVLDLDGGVSGGRGALLVDGGNADGDDQAARQNPIIPRVDRDDGGRRCAHGLAWLELGHNESLRSVNLHYRVLHSSAAHTFLHKRSRTS